MRYTASVCKLCRRVNVKLMLKGSRCLTPKCAVGRRRKVMGGGGRRRRVSDRGLQLLEKQKARYTFGLMERQFRQSFARAEKQPGITGDNLKVLLARRLDNVVQSLGFADSRAQARQLVLHGHILVNGHKLDIASSLVKEGDTIRWRESSTKTEYYKQLLGSIQAKSVPTWLTLNRETLVAQVVSLPVPDETGAMFDSKAVVEFYSR
ncbi:MAG: 30S ribosomal protein S4 [Dehalococcoidales bacterium]|nr:30S ribosomal protein S4 [Dehalococcoidales bacterium]